MSKGYTIFYRQGGKLWFRWNPVFKIFDTKEKAQQDREEIERMGFKTVCLPYGSSPPETWDPSQSVEDFQDHKGWKVHKSLTPR